MRKLVLTFGLASFASLFLLSAPASAILVDDFSDGNDVGWVRGDSLSAGGPGVFDATTGSYHLSSTSLVSADQEYVSAAWQDSASDPSFSDGTFTVRVRMDNASTNASLFMRSDQLASPSAYGFSVNNSLDLLLISLTLSGTDSYLASTSFTVNDGTDYWLSAEAIGSDLALKFWEVGSSEPVAPLLSASDSTLTLGQIGLATYHWGSDAVLSASFDDVHFVPEPSAGLLVSIGLTGLAARRRSLRS